MDFEVTYSEEQQRFRAGGARLARRACAAGRRADARVGRGQLPALSRPARAGADARRQGLALSARARDLWRRRARSRPRRHPRGGGRSPRSLAAAVLRQRRAPRRGVDPGLGHRGAEARVPAADLHGSGADVAAPERARRGLRPGEREHDRPPRRRRVRAERGRRSSWAATMARIASGSSRARIPTAAATRTSPGS